MSSSQTKKITHISQISGNRDTIPCLKAKICSKYDFDPKIKFLKLELQGQFYSDISKKLTLIDIVSKSESSVRPSRILMYFHGLWAEKLSFVNINVQSLFSS